MPPQRGVAFRSEGPPNENAAPTANRDGADRRNGKKLGASPNKYEPRPGSSTGKKPGPTKKKIVDDRFADETPQQRAKHLEIALHYAGDFAWDDRDNPNRPKPSAKKNARMRDLEAVIEHRCRGRQLTPDDAGRDYLWYAAHHVYHFGGDPDRNIRAWALEWGADLSDDELTELIERVCKRPLKWRADTLGKKLRLTREDRAGLRADVGGITTIGAFDDSAGKRKKRRDKRKNGRRQARRHAAGAKPQAASIARAEPWKAAGISRRTWFRRRKAAKSTPVQETPSPAYSITANLSFEGSVALNGTTLAPTRYSSNCWGPSAEDQVFRQAPVTVNDGRDRSGAGAEVDGRSLPLTRVVPASTDIGADNLLFPKKTVIVEKEEDCPLCLKGIGTDFLSLPCPCRDWGQP